MKGSLKEATIGPFVIDGELYEAAQQRLDRLQFTANADNTEFYSIQVQRVQALGLCLNGRVPPQFVKESKPSLAVAVVIWCEIQLLSFMKRGLTDQQARDVLDALLKGVLSHSESLENDAQISFIDELGPMWQSLAPMDDFIQLNVHLWLKNFVPGAIWLLNVITLCPMITNKLLELRGDDLPFRFRTFSEPAVGSSNGALWTSDNVTCVLEQWGLSKKEAKLFLGLLIGGTCCEQNSKTAKRNLEYLLKSLNLIVLPVGFEACKYVELMRDFQSTLLVS